MSKVIISQINNNMSTKENVERILSELDAFSNIVHHGDLVLIKPNFVAPFANAVTSFEVLQAIIDKVKEHGGRPVIGESSGFEFDTETTFRILGAYKFADRNQVDLINFDTCEFVNVKTLCGIIRKVKIPRIVKEANVLINVPKLKRHSLTKVTIGIKNLFGMLHRETRRKIHAFDLERGIFEVARILSPDLTLVDGSVVTDRAVFGAQSLLGIFVGGTDVYSVDKHSCKLLGVDFQNVEHIRLAFEEGVAEEMSEVIYLGNSALSIRDAQALMDHCDSNAKRMLRLCYQAMYATDITYAWLSGGKSLIPRLHFHFGIRPKLNIRKCNSCGLCEPICPVKAISIERKKIDIQSCMLVRCLKCIESCPEGAITIRGRQTSESVERISKLTN
jgi:uncharacterized protein (DUF362 family)/Pyruvate/2-oxoacid:ferredoxin oxidoreductase delta subunit